jgi:hypothetical protein
MNAEDAINPNYAYLRRFFDNKPKVVHIQLA